MFPMLSTENLEHALGFYRGLLGGTETYRFPEDGPPAFVVLRLGESDIGLGAISPTDQPWGERVAYVSDPDGNLVMLTRE